MKMTWKAAAACALVAVVAPATANAVFSDPPAVYIGGAFGGVFNTVCIGVLDGINPVTGRPIDLTDADPVTKTVVREDRSNGSSDFRVTLTGPIPATTIEADGYDCVWIDANTNGLRDPGENVRAYLSSGLTVDGTGSTRSITFQLNVPGAAGKQVCNRGYGIDYGLLSSSAGSQSGIETGSWVYFYSGKVCTAPLVPPQVPETSQVVLLAITGVLTGGAILGWRRRSARNVAA
jgi:hypothetical protein